MLGYFTLATGAIPLDFLPPAPAAKLPKHPIPTALLARLAVDQTMQGQGLGKLLLIDALRRCAEASTLLGIYAVEVAAIDDQALRFYQKYGFTALADDARRLYLPIKSVAGLV